MVSISYKPGEARLSNYLYILPACLFIGLFFITSVIFTIYMSFFEWDGFSSMVFTGLRNYSNIFKDPNFFMSTLNTLIWVGGSLILSVLIPLLFAVLITNSSFFSFFKYLFYLPSALSGAVGAAVIGSLLGKYGIPRLLGMAGFKNLEFDWLSKAYVNTFVMIGSGIWASLGFNMILFIVGLRSIPQDPIEAAAIDGANVFQKYFKVVFPMLGHIFKVVLLHTIVNSFKVFDGIWILTMGGPFRSSETLALTMYVESFVRNRMGQGAAVAIVLSIVIIAISYFQMRNSFSKEQD
ncbi:MAG: sugar ABC transporter permease [Treponema sp.]|jgi:multiple sugar transport system permease protein|nr:sugar ABC transporter permease [Treponema sp.]